MSGISSTRGLARRLASHAAAKSGGARSARSASATVMRGLHTIEGPPPAAGEDSFRAIPSTARFSSAAVRRADTLEPEHEPVESFEPVDMSAQYYEGPNAATHINHANLPVKTPPLDSLDIKWEQWGNPHAPGDKTIVIFPSFSHGSHAKSSSEDEKPGWWEFIIGPGEYLDTNKYRIICPSFIGSPHGATNPTTWNPETDRPYGPDFPHITPADMARGHAALLESLGIDKVHAVIGGSLGGMQVVAFATLFPDMTDRAVVISGTARTSPFSSALRLVQRNAIEGDPEFRNGLYNAPGVESDGPVAGLKAARMMGMMWYRSREEFDNRFQWGIKVDETEHHQAPFLRTSDPTEKPISDVQSYLMYQAEKFSNNFDANCYLLLSRGMDTFDLGWSANRWVPGFKDAAPPGETKDARLERALNRVTAKVQVIGVVQDALIPLSEQKNVYDVLKKNGKNVSFIPINDKHGHDAMFNAKVCSDKFAPVISSFIEADGEALDQTHLKLQEIKEKPVNPSDLGSFTRTIMGARAAEIIEKLPFHLPYDTWLRHVGNTPTVEIEDGIYAKLEGSNPGGSIKDRALTALVLNKFVTGELQASNSTLALATSGWAGMSLTHLHTALSQANSDFKLNLVLVIPLAYAQKSIPAQIIEHPSVKTFYGGFDEYLHAKSNDNVPEGTVNLVLEDSTFIEALEKTHAVVKQNKWVLVDQHHDVSGMYAHASTALELLCQHPDLTDVVCATGTGATAAGLRNYLPMSVNVHSRPAKSGTVDGLTDVNRYNNFCDAKSLVGYNTGDYLSVGDAVQHQQILKGDHGINAGPSSGSCFWLARQVRAENPDAKIAFISADGFLEDKSNMNDGFQGRLGHIPEAHHGNRAMLGAAGGIRAGGRGEWKMGGSSQTRMYSTSRPADAEYVDHIVVGGGPVGTATAWQLGERASEMDEPESVMLVHDPKNPGAHEDWSRLARLSFDGPEEEMELSRHAIDLLDMVDEVRSYQSGAPIVPLRPGMLFLASPGTPMAQACAYAEANYGDPEFVRRHPSELEAIFPGNEFTLPEDTLCWSHPTGYCVSPIELCNAQLKTAEAYDVVVKESIADIDMDGDLVKVTLRNGEEYITKKCYLFAGAQNGEILEKSLKRDEVKNADLDVPEFDNTYITAISTVRYKHVNHPARPAEGSGHVVTPITLGQLEIPGLIDFQANFSIVAEEYGDVLKTRLSGSIGSEVIPYAKEVHSNINHEDDAKMAEIYQNFFGALFPFLDTSKPLDFNRCVTYRNHGAQFSGTSILEKQVGNGDASLMTTVGCFGVGVKFGPALGEAAAAHAHGDELQTGMNVFQSGDEDLLDTDLGEKIERAW